MKVRYKYTNASLS